VTGGALPRRITTPDGVELALHRLRAHRDGRPAILLVHGAFTNHRFWLYSSDGAGAAEATGPTPDRGGLAHFLGAAGFDVWLADLRHHGESAREPRRGAWTFEDWVLHDAPALVARVREETDGAPLAWLGHSAGGAAGLCWLARVAASAPIRAVVTLGTPGPRRLGPVRRALAGLTIAVSRALGRFPARALRFGNEDEAAEIIAEWMEWNVRGAWIGTDGFDYFAGLAALHIPYLGVAGAADRIFAPPSACRQVVDRIGAARKQLAIAAGLSHRGLVLDPRARESCWPDITAWLKETL
jgi:alpha-beta hydrolase superfamily lysophospholipase